MLFQRGCIIVITVEKKQMISSQLSKEDVTNVKSRLWQLKKRNGVSPINKNHLKNKFANIFKKAIAKMDKNVLSNILLMKIKK